MEQLGLVVKKERSVCKFQSWGLSSIRNTFIFEIRTKKVIIDLKSVTGAPLLSDVLSMVTYSDKYVTCLRLRGNSSFSWVLAHRLWHLDKFPNCFSAR